MRASLFVAAALVGLLVAGLSAVTALAGVGRTEARHLPTSVTARVSAHLRPLVFGSMASAGPVAEADGLNPVVEPFSFLLNYPPSSTNSQQIALTSFQIKPFFPGEAAPLGGCLRCLGKGFKSYTVKNNTLTEVVRGARLLLTTRTRFSQAIVRRGEIGRFKVLGIKVDPARPFRRQQGCLGADTNVTNNQLIFGLALPVVACSAPTPRDVTTHFLAPAELSNTLQGHGSVTGDALGQRWLSLFKVHASCGANAQATSRIPGESHVFWSVRGRFHQTFVTGLDTRAGHFCVYLQDGGRWHNVPDGRISQRGSFPFFGGDSVSITGASTGTAGLPVADTFAGFASTAETLWTFDSKTPCAATAEAEFPGSLGFASNNVKGPFSLAINSVPLAQSVFRCAYLQAGAPLHGMPTGPTLATASALITVT